MLHRIVILKWLILFSSGIILLQVCRPWCSSISVFVLSPSKKVLSVRGLLWIGSGDTSFVRVLPVSLWQIYKSNIKITWYVSYVSWRRSAFGSTARKNVVLFIISNSELTVFVLQWAYLLPGTCRDIFPGFSMSYAQVENQKDTFHRG